MEASSDAGERHGAAWQLHRIVVAAAAMDVALAHRLELTPVEYAAMKHLLVREPPIGPVELGSLVGLSSGAATALVDRLERDGHVERRPHPVDRRRRIVRPTVAARRRAADAIAPLNAALEDLEAGLDEADVSAAEAYLRRAEELFQAFNRDPGAVDPDR